MKIILTAAIVICSFATQAQINTAVRANMAEINKRMQKPVLNFLDDKAKLKAIQLPAGTAPVPMSTVSNKIKFNLLTPGTADAAVVLAVFNSHCVTPTQIIGHDNTALQLMFKKATPGYYIVELNLVQGKDQKFTITTKGSKQTLSPVNGKLVFMVNITDDQQYVDVVFNGELYGFWYFSCEVGEAG